MKNGVPSARLDVAQLMAERRLRQAQPFGCRRHAAGVGDPGNETQMADLEIHVGDPSAPNVSAYGRRDGRGRTASPASGSRPAAWNVASANALTVHLGDLRGDRLAVPTVTTLPHRHAAVPLLFDAADLEHLDALRRHHLLEERGRSLVTAKSSSREAEHFRIDGAHFRYLLSRRRSLRTCRTSTCRPCRCRSFL